jgi:hypothetical protein
VTNKYFNFQTSYNEQNLVENMVIESIQIYGMDIQFCPKTLVDFSSLYGEDPQRAFNSAYTIEAYMENVDGFMGDKNFLNKLGLNIDKQATFIMAKRRFDEEFLGLNWKKYWSPTVTYNVNDALHYQGLIYVNALPITLILTGISGTLAVNDIIVGQNSNATGTILGVNSNVLTINQTTGSFSTSEILSDTTSSASATISGVSSNLNIVPGTDTLTLTGVTGIFTSGDLLSGSVSNATAVVVSFNTMTSVMQINETLGRFLYNETLLDTTSSATATITNVNIITGTNLAAWTIMTQVRPKEGDLIYLPITHDIFEILFADHEEVFYQLGKIYVWKLTCEKFRFSHETLDTGVPDIDSIATELENDNSIINDPLADNTTIADRVENFLNLDPNAPF